MKETSSQAGEPPIPEVCPICATPLGGRAWCVPCLLRGAVQPGDDPGVVPGPEAGMAGVFGDYRLRERLGEGGMGVVYRATKVSLKKDVAIKFIKAGRQASERQVALFLREAELASHLDHPDIIPVLEVGERDGTRFLVMRFVDGQPLSERLASADFLPTVRERVGLVLRIARAVHHAHQRGVIHRDLKPGNILIGPDGSPQVGDFGLARWVERETTVTVGDRAIGTPAYMAPEQARGSRDELTTASDVWSLGVMLYQLLSGRLPFVADTLVGVVHRILNEDPPGPLSDDGTEGRRGEGASSGGAGGESGDEMDGWAERLPAPADAGQLFGPARRDLESICLRCLRKESARRYASALALAEDLERWLGGKPVEARPVAGLERVALWVRRRPAVAALAAVSGLAVVATGWTIWQAGVNSRTERLRREFNYVADLNLVRQSLSESNSVVFDRAMTDAGPGVGEEDLRGVDWGLFHTLGEAATHPVWFRSEQPLLRLAVAAQGGWVAVAGTNAVQVLNGTGEAVRRWPREGSGEGGALAFTPAGDWLVVGDGAGLDVLSVRGESQVHLTRAAVSGLAVSADGRWLAALAGPEAGGTEPARVLVFDLRSGSRQHAYDRRALALAWLADGVGLRLGGERGEVFEGLPGEGGGLSERVGGGYRCPAMFLSPDGRWAARTSIYGVAHLFEAESGTEVRRFRGLPVGGVRMAFSGDGRKLALTTTESAVRVVDLTRDGAEVEGLPGHVGAITALAFSANGREVLSASRDGTIRRMDPSGPRREPFVRVPHGLPTGAGVAPRFSPDGRWVALLEERGYMPPYTNEWTVLWDTREGRVAGRVPGEVVGWSEAGRLVSWDRDGRLRMWGVEDPSRAQELGAFRVNNNHHVKIDSQLVDGGRWVVSLTASWEVQAFEVASGRVRSLPGRRVELLAGAPQGARVAVAWEGGGAALWDIRTGRLSPLQDASPADMRYSASGRLLAVTDWDRQLRLFDGGTGKPLAGLRGHLGAVAAAAFTPDDRQLVTGGDDYSLVVWSLATRREVLRLRLDAPVYWIQISPDQRWLVTGHLPTEVGMGWGSVGRGHYRLWPLTGRAPRRPDPRPAAADSVWEQYRRLAERYPP